MRIVFSPVRSDAPFEVSRKGTVLTINGEAFDMATATMETCPWLADPVGWRGPVPEVRLIRPHGARAGSADRFPAPREMTGDGPVQPGAAQLRA